MCFFLNFTLGHEIVAVTWKQWYARPCLNAFLLPESMRSPKSQIFDDFHGSQFKEMTQPALGEQIYAVLKLSMSFQ